jgi:SAM-dependent methyltransferase
MSDSDLDSKAHWEDVYNQKRAEETSWHQDEPALSLELIERSAIGRDAALIDIGGGASRLVDRLLALGYSDLTVLDISAAALRQVQERLGGRAAEVRWEVADVTRFEPGRPFGLWHDRAVFHFLTRPDDRRAYVDRLTQWVEPGGQVIIAAFAADGPRRCSGLDIVRYDAAKLGAELGGEFILQEEQREIHLTPAGREQRFGFYRYQKVA